MGICYLNAICCFEGLFYDNIMPARDYIIKFKVPQSYHPTKRNEGSDLKDSDADSKGKIYVKSPVRNDLSLDMGIYCDCDDYLVNPDEYNELKASTFNTLGLLAMLTTLFILAKRED